LVKSVRINKQGHGMLSVESRYQQVGKTEGPWELSTEQQHF
jgi:hypothetical protein